MTARAVDAFREELDLLIDRFEDEWDLNYAEAIGILEIVKLNLHAELLELENEEEIDDDED